MSVAGTFAVGDAVVVSAREHAGHHRTPGYLKGCGGTIARVHATFLDPETRAYGGTGLPERQLYLVAFPATVSTGGAPVYADLFEHWLERPS